MKNEKLDSTKSGWIQDIGVHNNENVNSKKSKTPTAEVSLDNVKGCVNSCVRNLLDINDKAQKASSHESAKKATQNLILSI